MLSSQASPQPGIAKNGGGQNASATGGPGILPETRDAIPWAKVDNIGRLAQCWQFNPRSDHLWLLGRL
jgi:hypothetical protein